MPEKPAAKTVPGKWDLITPQGSRAGEPSKVKTAPKAPKHTVAAIKHKKQILPVALVNEAKRALPKMPKTTVRAPRRRTGNYPNQPLVDLSPGPQDPNLFLCLQPFLNANSVSVGQVPDSTPVEEIVPEVAAPVEDQNLITDPLMDTTQPDPPTGDMFWGAQLEAVMATGQITVKKLAPPAALETVEVSTLSFLLQLTDETSSKDLPPSQLPEETSPEHGFGLYDSW